MGSAHEAYGLISVKGLDIYKFQLNLKLDSRELRLTLGLKTLFYWILGAAFFQFTRSPNGLTYKIHNKIPNYFHLREDENMIQVETRYRTASQSGPSRNTDYL